MGEQNAGLQPWTLCSSSTDCTEDEGEGDTELSSPWGKDTEEAREVTPSHGRIGPWQAARFREADR